MSDEPAATERRPVAIREATVVVALGLLAIWLIRTQTTQGPVLGLPPAFLPTVCAVAIVALGLLGLALRLWQPEPLQPERAVPAWPAAMMLGIVAAGVLALHLAGPVAGGLVIVGLGLAALKERRPLILIGTLSGAALVLGLVFQVWR